MLTETQINQMVEQSETVESTVINAAIVQMEKEKQERKVAAAVEAIRQISGMTKSAVAELRCARKMERIAKAAVVLYASAEAEFRRTGDIKVYAEKVYPNNTRNQARLVSQFADLVNS